MKLIKYHILVLPVFSALVISAFYFLVGGNSHTSSTIALYYIISATLLYIPIIISIIAFNFLITGIGLLIFKEPKKLAIIFFIPVLLFSSCFVYFNNSFTDSYFLLNNLQFFIVTGIWFSLVLLGLTIYTGNKEYAISTFLSFIPLIVCLFFPKYNIVPIKLSPVSFNAMLFLFSTLNCYLIYRSFLKNRVLQSQVSSPLSEK